MNILRAEIGFNHLGIVLDFLRLPLGYHLTEDQDLDAVAEFHDKLHPMLNKEDGHPEFSMHLADDGNHPDELIRGHARSGFIQEKDFWVGCHGPGHLHPALGSVGQAAHHMLGKLADVKGLHQPVAMLLDFFFLSSAGRGGEKGPEQAVAELGIMGQPDMIQHVHVPPKEQVLKGSADSH